MKVVVLKQTGKDTGRKADLAKSIYEIEPNDHAIYLDVKQYLANQRQGTHKTKERGDVAGSRRKVKRQKGTGSARFGDIKNPLFRGGGTVFGPRPRDYNTKLNKKLKKVARRSALSYKAKEKNIAVLEGFKLEAPKTNDYLKFLNALSLSDKKTLLVLPEHDYNIFLSSRNLKNAQVTTAEQLCTYDVIHADNLLISEDSLKKIENILN
ncbi:MAG: 50S ribosomal protein L4 [Bacteroidetes bacterium]|nr:50S ribosomal protein L4 [Bacteroidota bacterium]MCZ6900762.1 50S ribosomal protein L4 [Bacteroidota bacterium]